MTASMYQGEGMYQEVVGPKAKGKLPGPAVQPYLDRQPNKPMSDMQHIMENERRQHEQTYIYENGHNDHGMGQ